MPHRGNQGPDESVHEHKDVALHELIRLPDRNFAAQIKEFDVKFEKKPDKVTIKDIRDYKKLVSTASVEELKRAQVILCTCGTSGNNLYKTIFEKINQVCSF